MVIESGNISRPIPAPPELPELSTEDLNAIGDLSFEVDENLQHAMNQDATLMHEDVIRSVPEVSSPPPPQTQPVEAFVQHVSSSETQFPSLATLDSVRENKMFFSTTTVTVRQDFYAAMVTNRDSNPLQSITKMASQPWFTTLSPPSVPIQIPKIQQAPVPDMAQIRSVIASLDSGASIQANVHSLPPNRNAMQKMQKQQATTADTIVPSVRIEEIVSV
jgi:hypothetical protein